ncbi:MAG: enoyl-CoA hydratase/isomerase family protein [Planctomycetota bacterium]|nr:MAG: enoyl-CoA hydratase/isomerase family protein [Planctomycetota bacterium]
MANGKVQTRVLDRVAWLRMTAPPANNYSYEMMQDLDAAILAVRFDPEIDVLVLTGEGDRFFSSGADIDTLSKVTPEYKYAFCLHANETLLRLEHTPKLSLAAINGHCVGGGLEVALACDLRLGRLPAAGGKAFRYGAPEVKLGVLPGTGGTQRLARLLGPAQAMQFMVEGTLLETEAAREFGLLHRTFEFDGFEAAIQEYARRFTCPNSASLAVGHIKRAVQSGTDLPLESGLSLERELQQRLFASRDAGEGLAAFRDKRPPQFEGR